MKYLDDLLILAGCLLVLAQTWRINPVVAVYMAAGMLIVAGLLVGIWKAKA